MASVRQRIQVLAHARNVWLGCWGQSYPGTTALSRKKIQSSVANIRYQFVYVSATSARGAIDMMDPNKVSDLVKGTGIEDEDRMSASSAW